MKIKFYGSIKDGKLMLEDKEKFDIYIKGLEYKTKPETKVEIMVKRYRKKRSDNQNAYYWVCLGVIEKETGQMAESLHQTFKGMFLRKTVKVKGKNIKIIPSTTELNTLQFTEYFNKIEDFIRDFGIILPNPDDLYQ